MSGPREDTGSRTPEDAAAFEAWRARRYDEDPIPDGPDEYPDATKDPDADECMCSDPGCPCGGEKRGGSP